VQLVTDVSSVLIFIVARIAKQPSVAAVAAAAVAASLD
jgi:hypothetical protein